MSNHENADRNDRDAALRALTEVVGARHQDWLAMNPGLQTGRPGQVADMGTAFAAGWMACTEWSQGR